MKKIIFLAAIVLLAGACSKSQPVVNNAPAQNQPPVATSTSPSISQKPILNQPPLTLSIYNNAPEHFKISYLSYFKLFTGGQVKANSTKGVNFSACVPYGLNPDMCFVLNNQPYQNTNLSSAAVAVKILKDRTTIGDCGNFTAKDLNGGNIGKPFQGNGVVFITAVATDAGAGNYSETHFNRAFYGTICYEIDETARWANAGNYEPTRQEFNRDEVWGKLDVLRNGFQFVK